MKSGQFIFALANNDIQLNLDDIPSNVHVFDYVPQLRVLKFADCAVIDSGISSIAECLEFNVPMLIYSLGHACQNGCAARITYHNLGLVGDRKTDTPEQTLSKVSSLISDSSLKKRQAEYKNRVSYYKTENRVAEIVEGLIDT